MIGLKSTSASVGCPAKCEGLLPSISHQGSSLPGASEGQTLSHLVLSTLFFHCQGLEVCEVRPQGWELREGRLRSTLGSLLETFLDAQVMKWRPPLRGSFGWLNQTGEMHRPAAGARDRHRQAARLRSSGSTGMAGSRA